MPEIVFLEGRQALSTFRLDKLLIEAQNIESEISEVSAYFCHFVEVMKPPTADQLSRLNRILSYGPSASKSIDRKASFVVVPRLGSISPWSTKATEIAQACGLSDVLRVERGVSWIVNTRSGKTLPASKLTVFNKLAHDRMTETVLDELSEAKRLFHHVEPQHMKTIPILKNGKQALDDIDRELGLALSDDEIDYLHQSFKTIGRDPTDVELMMFAQANSEHCRHKIFNASWVIDGKPQEKSLFGMIRETHRQSPKGTVVAYSDNSAIMEGVAADRFRAMPNHDYEYVSGELTHTLMKVETHNHPTAISPFPGAATGSGGEIRDEGATGRGAKPKAGLVGFSVSHLRIPELKEPWESAGIGKPDRIASALDIMLEGPVGGAAFNNEFGRPNLCGYFRNYEQQCEGVVRGYHKPIMLAGGLGNVTDSQSIKEKFDAGVLIIQLGGPGMLIGMGGGAASSMATGDNSVNLDFDSVQRGNPEIQRRCQEVIDRCWGLGADNPILSIHDVGAGGLSNALPELVNDANCGARIDIRKIPSEESGMTPMQIWSNESQERYMLAVDPNKFEQFNGFCERERCPYSLLGESTSDGHLEVFDSHFGNKPADIALSVILDKPPKMTRNVKRKKLNLVAKSLRSIDFNEGVARVLSFPAVADKTFLISIGDRSVGGLCSRDQFVGPWQIPVSDVAVTSMGFKEYLGEAFAIGERAPVAVTNGPASGRMAIGEAITNIAAAKINRLSDIKLSANWMAPAGFEGEDANLFDTVKAVGMELCPELGISIPVGKDSMSMRTVWQDKGEEKQVVSPVSLVITAFAQVSDIRKTLTPVLSPDLDTELILIDLSGGKNRLGGSIFYQAWSVEGGETPDLDDAAVLRGFFTAIQTLNSSNKILAYHDRSDGGLLATLAELVFASHLGVRVDLGAGSDKDSQLAALFNEELGAVIQVRAVDKSEVFAVLDSHGLTDYTKSIGSINSSGRLEILSNDVKLIDEYGWSLQRIWSKATFHMQGIRDNPECAEQEYDRILDIKDPGLHADLTFDIGDPTRTTFINTGVKPKVAILREQGVNGQIEMAAAFDRAGFMTVDVHMSDVITGRTSLADFKGLAACGGFSYGDVLGAGEGWAKSILFNSRAHEQFSSFFDREDSFALGICNGCQMMSNLREIIPGTTHWPRFVKNKSEQFEARFVMTEVSESPSIFLQNMVGSRIPVATAHGEGQVEFESSTQRELAEPYVALRYVDNYGQVTEKYPSNPNGSISGVTGLSSVDGRFTIMMPHPERVFRSVQNSWHPEQWEEDGAWMYMFRNARYWVG